MKLLFEGYHYPLECLQDLVSSHFYTLNKQGDRAWMNFVGYFFNNSPETPQRADSVFILPKVFLNERSEPFELEGILPEDIIDLDDENKKLLSNNKVSEMVSELSIWLYQAIQFYQERKSNSDIAEKAPIRDVISNRGKDSVTFLDTVLQLRKFYKDHRQMLTFVSIVNNSGHNKIQWSKTIMRELPIIRNNRPAYVKFYTKAKAVNFDEELIVLFYSVLNYLKQSFHFTVNVDVQYHLLPRKKIESMINGCKGTRYLKRIRKKYFTDEFVALWKLLYAYFDKAERVASRRYHEETLLVRNFNPVFEDMIDYLISDETYPEELRVQNSGDKIVDHLYEERSLIYDEHIYFVGDSKYYDTSKLEMDDHSITKQYTYAKNIIQRNIDVICGFDQDPGKQRVKDRGRYFKYRDELTKGYNITPNFFISGIAMRDQKQGYLKSDAQLTNITGNRIIYNRHFLNRLFDRDTLILQRYNINFLFVLTAYAAQQQSAREQFRRVARRDFREHIVKALREHYKLYQICLSSTDDMKQFVKRNYYQLAGRIFSFDGILLYAEEQMSNYDILPEEARNRVCLHNGKLMLQLEDEEVEVTEETIGDPIIKRFASEMVKGKALIPPMEEETDEWPIEVDINEEAQFATHLPVYTIRAACGTFNHGDTDEQEGWIDVSDTGIHCRPGMFIVHAEGNSMEPKIHDGDLCVFNHNDMGGSRNGLIVLVESNKYDCRHVIKEYHSTKEVTEEGWMHTSITLHSLNPDYDDIELTDEDEPKIAGFFVEVLHMG